MKSKARSKSKGSKLKSIVIGIAVLSVIGAFMSGNEDETDVKPIDPPAAVVQAETQQEDPIQEIEQDSEPTVKQDTTPATDTQDTTPATDTQAPAETPETAPTEPQPAQETLSTSSVETPSQVPESTPTLTPEQAFRESLYQYAYVGSSESDKYHTPSCRWVDKIHEGNLVHFDSKEAAAAAGYKPCGTCKP